MILCALLWIGALCSVVGMSFYFSPGWDLAVYQHAMWALQDGKDPYAVSQAAQIAAHAQGHRTFTYVYPPLTTLLLRVLNYVPSLPGRMAYWLLYVAGFGCQLWAGYQLAGASERKLLRYLLPLVAFFPGLMPNEMILSGNIAIPLYGAVMVGVIRGWKQQGWGWFYASVLAASLFKLPMLTLLAIPVLMGEFVGSAIVAMSGLAMFFIQKIVWPVEFHEYLGDIQMQFTLNHDFGSSAAGVLGHTLEAMGRPFATASAVFYVVYAAAIFVVLARLAFLYRRNALDGRTWMTVLLAGTILLNPRIMRYDSMAATVPMILLAIRGWQNAIGRRCLLIGVATVTCAYLAGADDAGDAMLLISTFAVGVLGLLLEVRSGSGAATDRREAEALAQ